MGSFSVRLAYLLVASTLAVACLSLAWKDFARSIPISVRVRDAETGARIETVSLSLRPLDEEARNASAPSALIPESENVVPVGTWAVHASAPGYRSMSAEVSVGDGPHTIELHLDPVELPDRLVVARARHAASPNAFLHCGFVTESDTGRPIATARVRHVSGREAVSSDDGYFELWTPGNWGGRSALAVAAPGMVTQIRANQLEWPGGDATARVRLRRGIGVEVIGPAARLATPKAEPCTEPCVNAAPASDPAPILEDFEGTVPALPKNIRVGRNCASRTTCTVVEVYSLQTYCKRVLSAEWYSCWGSLSGGMNSLKAGAVAVRSYGVSFVYNPATSTYDICDTTSCQVMGDSYTTNASNAVDQTERYVLTTASGSIARSEYSAENNNSGCGDGFTGTGTSWPCIADPVCAGFARNGHGRGLCQWGSARWATGRRLSASQACTSSAPSTGQPIKTWTQILDHYYPNYDLVQGATAAPTTFGAAPNPVPAASRASLDYGVVATASVNVLLGASIAPAGSGSWISDPPHDSPAALPAGSSHATRPFDVPYNAPLGSYDVWLALYFDRNGNGQIGSGDFVMGDARFDGSLTVSASIVAVRIEPGFARIGPGQSRSFSATVSGTWNPAVTWSVVSGPGSIHPMTGQFTAGATPGATTTIRATSSADPTRSSTARVFVIGSTTP